MHITNSMLTQVGTQHFHLLVGSDEYDDPDFNIKFDNLEQALYFFYGVTDEFFPGYLEAYDKQVIREQIAEAVELSEDDISVGGTISKNGLVIELLDCYGCLYVNNN